MAYEESDIYRNLFGDIIQSYEAYDFVPTKDPSFHSLAYTHQDYKKFLDEWISPSFQDKLAGYEPGFLFL